jgi:Protein of unknown function, DUF488
VFTASFAAVPAGLVVPVLTTVGTPRFVGFPMVEWRTVAPYGLLQVADQEEFRRRYRHRLHRLTPRILAELRELVEAYAPTPLALCCFEADPVDCHRSILARWLREKGVQVTELS